MLNIKIFLAKVRNFIWRTWKKWFHPEAPKTPLSIDEIYSNILKDILENGIDKEDRTGVGTRSITGSFIKYDMSLGFPALWGKRIPFKSIAVELEGFLKGITSKSWYKERGCTLWNSWSKPNPEWKNLSDEERKQEQLESDDLGKMYGYQYRNFNSQGYDQVRQLLNDLEKNPNSRRHVVLAWNPLELGETSLPACHFAYQVVIRGEFIDLCYYQRSCDKFLGSPSNIASYALLLSLLAKQFNYKPGFLVGHLADTHIYLNHMEQVKEYLNRVANVENQEAHRSRVELRISDEFQSVLSFDHKMVSLEGYNPMPMIRAEVAV